MSADAHAQTHATATKPPTAEEAKKFVADAEQSLLKLWIEAGRADWVKSTYITDDTEILAAAGQREAIAAGVEVRQAGDALRRPRSWPETARKLKLLKLSLTAAAPADPAEAAELTRLARRWRACTARASTAPTKDKCLDLEELTKIMAKSRDPKSCSRSGPAGTRSRRRSSRSFVRYVELANKGARELGFADTGAMWRSKYDMPPDDFAAEVDRLWEQVKPLYDSLHAYVRRKLREKYGDVVPPTARSPRTCSATCGRRSGATSTRWSRRRAPIPATT